MYTVQENDTVGGICEKFNLTREVFFEMNPDLEHFLFQGVKTAEIFLGQRIFVEDSATTGKGDFFPLSKDKASAIQACQKTNTLYKDGFCYRIANENGVYAVYDPSGKKYDGPDATQEMLAEAFAAQQIGQACSEKGGIVLRDDDGHFGCYQYGTKSIEGLDVGGVFMDRPIQINDESSPAEEKSFMSKAGGYLAAAGAGLLIGKFLL